MSNAHSSQSGVRALTPEEQDWYVRIRGRAASKVPWITHVLFLLDPVMDDELGTFAVDDKARVYLSRQGFTGSLNEEEQAFALVHECMHVFRHHAERTGAFTDFQARNLACDAEINDDLKKTSLQAPAGLIYPSTIGQKVDRTAEEYYQAIRQKSEKLTKSLSKKMQDQMGGGAGNNDDASSENITNPACAGINAGDSQEADAVTSGRENADIESAVMSASQEVLDAASNNRGSVPASIVRAARANLGEAKVSWVDVFSTTVANHASEISSGRASYSYRKVNRRAENDDILPGLIDYKVKIGVVLDTSGSMSESLIKQCINELASIQEQPNVVMKYAPADAKVYEIHDFSADVDITGGGGTDMGLAIDGFITAASEMNFHPDLMVVLTDGYTGWDRESEIPVTAAIINNDEKTAQSIAEAAESAGAIHAIPVSA